MNKILWISSCCVHDLASESALQVRNMISELAERNASVVCLSTDVRTSADLQTVHPAARKELQFARNKVMFEEGKVQYVYTMTAQHRLAQMTTYEQSLFYNEMTPVICGLKPDVVVVSTSDILSMACLNLARNSGIPCVFALLEPPAEDFSLRDVDLIVSTSRSLIDDFVTPAGREAVYLGPFVSSNGPLMDSYLKARIEHDKTVMEARERAAASIESVFLTQDAASRVHEAARQTSSYYSSILSSIPELKELNDSLDNLSATVSASRTASAAGAAVAGAAGAAGTAGTQGAAAAGCPEGMPVRDRDAILRERAAAIEAAAAQAQSEVPPIDWSRVPFPDVSERRYIVMVSPNHEHGLGIFLGLARECLKDSRFEGYKFAVYETEDNQFELCALDYYFRNSSGQAYDRELINSIEVINDKDFNDLMSMTRVLVMPTLSYVSNSSVGLQALSHGTAVITTGQNVLREQLLQAGRYVEVDQELIDNLHQAPDESQIKPWVEALYAELTSPVEPCRYWDVFSQTDYYCCAMRLAHAMAPLLRRRAGNSPQLMRRGTFSLRAIIQSENEAKKRAARLAALVSASLLSPADDAPANDSEDAIILSRELDAASAASSYSSLTTSRSISRSTAAQRSMTASAAAVDEDDLVLSADD
ncbi:MULTISPECIES: hypothetical protein [unclassified Anaerobiospirillum]|uniref:hypothetical protein n=1 Tax=unclassified Anaerobiospirillum TaxID=2647410 RepID=UPI001FF2DA56|nr:MULTISPECIES: hypothetical protein [unclassified Anaerobiospirillum]MCK0534488.1 hypothetical protein [Anaerobiospirillum sp. NML120511]MCK0539849.1 hypothetical protein [Anaerobiospirillum sp. NML02-A-032]